MTSIPAPSVPAFRLLADAVEWSVLHDPRYRERFTARYAPESQTWHDLTPDGSYAPTATLAEVTEPLRRQVRDHLDADVIPLQYRCVGAPRHVRDYVHDWHTARHLRDVTSWETAPVPWLGPEDDFRLTAWRAREAKRAEQRAEFVAAGIPEDHPIFEDLDPRPCPVSLRTLISETQRDALLKACTPKNVEQAVRQLSTHEALRLRSTTALLAEWAPESFVASLRQVPGARIGERDLVTAYEAQVPEGHRPVPARRLLRLVRKTYGYPSAPREKTYAAGGFPTFEGLALPTEEHPTGARIYEFPTARAAS